jgi:hypothetical protein
MRTVQRNDTVRRRYTPPRTVSCQEVEDTCSNSCHQRQSVLITVNSYHTEGIRSVHETAYRVDGELRMGRGVRFADDASSDSANENLATHTNAIPGLTTPYDSF